jgi:rubrerythrin
MILFFYVLVSAEYEAIQLYMQLAESIGNLLAKAVLIDIEERLHVGKFLRLLHEIEPSEKKFYKLRCSRSQSRDRNTLKIKNNTAKNTYFSFLLISFSRI